jgi:hypothetical protein
VLVTIQCQGLPLTTEPNSSATDQPAIHRPLPWCLAWQEHVHKGPWAVLQLAVHFSRGLYSRPTMIILWRRISVFATDRKCWLLTVQHSMRALQADVTLRCVRSCTRYACVGFE